jgi:galactan endo-1,6-beta-galactosidase
MPRAQNHVFACGVLAFAVLFAVLGNSLQLFANLGSSPVSDISIDPSQDLGNWEGWGSSLAWWARAIGGTSNADYYADLIYTTKVTDGYPGLGLNIVRYNVGGGGIDQRGENKGPKLQWQMDIHGYWSNPKDTNPTSWNWALDGNQRAILLKARQRGANVFEMFSDSPVWWMNSNHSTAGSDTGGNCLLPENYDRFVLYLATVARYSADHWGIRFGSIEPFNEPSADWWKYPGRQEGCHFDVSTQRAIVQLLRKALDKVDLKDAVVAAADENDVEVALNTWSLFDATTRASIRKVNVHGYYHGTESYRGASRPALRRAVGGKRLWQSEYGDGDGSGYTMANSIIQDLRGLNPSAWVYWQPIEPDAPEFGWGLINASYIDTHDEPSTQMTSLVRVNRKFFVLGQFTRYIRPGYHLINIDDANSIAAYDEASHTLVIVKVSAERAETVHFDLSHFAATAGASQLSATTCVPGRKVPDWKQHKETLTVERRGDRRLIQAYLHPKSVYTFTIENVSR